MDRKFSAMAAHRSAFGVTEEMVKNPSPGGSVVDAFRPAFEQEDFVLAGTRVATGNWPLNDLFDGLTVEAAPTIPRAKSH